MPIEPSHVIMVLCVLHKLVLQTPMRSHPVGLDFWFLVQPFVYFHTLIVQTVKALARLQRCAGSSEQMGRLASAIAARLCDKYHNLMSWLNLTYPMLSRSWRIFVHRFHSTPIITSRSWVVWRHRRGPTSSQTPPGHHPGIKIVTKHSETDMVHPCSLISTSAVRC